MVVGGKCSSQGINNIEYYFNLWEGGDGMVASLVFQNQAILDIILHKKGAKTLEAFYKNDPQGITVSVILNEVTSLSPILWGNHAFRPAP